MEQTKHVAIIGAGIAGMEAASQLVKAGCRVTLIEKDMKNGGHVARWSNLFPDFSDPEPIITAMNSRLGHKAVKVINNTEITDIEKNNGHFLLKAGSEMTLQADAVVIASGFRLFDASRKEEYGYGLFKNVITSADLEERFRKGGKILTPTGKKPRSIAIIHCVGSRDAKSGNTYCSKVCCITGVKQAIELNKLLPEAAIFCFYMDLRLYGLHFDDLYLKAQHEHNIQFIRGRLSEAAEKQDKSLQIKAEDTLSGRPLRMDVDMIVLLAGMEAGSSHANFTRNGLLRTDEHGFMQPEHIHTARSRSTVPGIFLAGSCTSPMSVCETLENARSASLDVLDYLDKITGP